MNPSENSVAFGAPGIEPRWTSSAKEGVGTAYHTSCRLWFTLSHGIVNEIYYPCVDQPHTRDFEFLISDGETFCHEEKRDLNHLVEYPERIILAAGATIVWSTDDWARTNRLDTTHESGLNLWFADFPTAELPEGSVFTFTSFWKRDQRWEGRNWQVSLQ